ncbi:hypothetical protein QRX60_29355 [Amycolatopsis mongoliensis]|uniref:Uncharacterized protein n=1 Tax=Amycolatopsis mongoliensis TaxID=715475 RepID=A0A9Y2JJT7_9PSEU|nr:hypothetical protein [Amycolatopsis sp. 4-36]WIX98173.1 hypothetical protein QRX60_29355 [Amycolatopsis sp. 4-36]
MFPHQSAKATVDVEVLPRGVEDVLRRGESDLGPPAERARQPAEPVR